MTAQMFRDCAAAGVVAGTGAVDGPASWSSSLAIGISAPGFVFADNCGAGHSAVLEFVVSAPLAPSIANARTKAALADFFMLYGEPDGAAAWLFR